MEGKLIIISAPSGCGKSTIIGRIMDEGTRDLRFSVSATNRSPRPGEQHGVHYYFLSDEEFKSRVATGDFVEFEEVYPGRFYGTLRSEIESSLKSGHNIVLDIDVKGGVNVKRQFGDRAISIFIEPPSIDALRSRLEGRGTDSAEVIEERVGRAEYELSFAPQYDCRIINDNLDTAVRDTAEAIDSFITKK
ncbi:MAG: guanylate kinase [Muribaculaceae bacterium]|nr:guanylate kinase [Muribaculaceae bacterium]